MHFLTTTALLGSAITLASAFRLGAVDLATNSVTPVTIAQTVGSVRILRAAADAADDAAAQFEYNAASKQLVNEVYGHSDAALADRVLTFGRFYAAADGGLAVVQKDAGDAEYIVQDAGRIDGWSLCGANGVYWSGEQEAEAGCAKVALQIL